MQFFKGRAPIVYAGIIAVTAAVFAWYLAANNLAPDFWQFILDRREGAGQTAPDKNALCEYSIVGGQSVHVRRKAHGHYAEHDLELSAPLVGEHYGQQQALFETEAGADTYNCINGEFLVHELSDPADDPISEAYFSVSGRNLAIRTQQADGTQGVEVFSYKTNEGESVWNSGFGSEEQGLVGDVQQVAMEGESLVVVLAASGGAEVHTYNYRRSHNDKPWNEQTEDAASLKVDAIIGAPQMLDRGRSTEIVTREAGKEVVRSFRFTCKRNPEKPEETCAWK